MISNEKHTFGYACVSSIIAIFLLIYASSPKLTLEVDDYNDIPTTIDNVKIRPERYYYPHVHNLVLFIVDGFGLEDLKGSNFPYVSKLLSRGKACFSTYKTQPFSSTIQKIKTLTRGSPNGFLDYILTINDTSSEDNIFYLAKEKNLKISFHSLNSKSQFFSNYAEKFEKVNNSFNNYFLRNDSDWLVFHFQASRNFQHSSNSKKALELNFQYLDSVIKSIHIDFLYIMRYKILIIGDSGNFHKDFKKHPNNFGPLITIQPQSCLTQMQNYQTNIQEFDITPLISVLTGLPIPSSSYGTIHLNFLSNLALHEKIYNFYYNSRKLLNNLANLKATKYVSSLIPIFQKTVLDHKEYFLGGEKNTTAGEKILKSYENLMNSFSQVIDDIRIQQNASMQFLAFILLIEALVMILNTPCKNSKTLKTFSFAFGFHVVLIVFVLTIGILKRVTSFIFISKEEAIAIAIIGIIMIFNTYILTKQKNFVSTFCSTLIEKAKKSKETLETLSSTVDLHQHLSSNKNSIYTVVILGTIFQTLGLLEISFVKAEKSVWFFLWTSICFWIIINKIKILLKYAFSTERNEREIFKNYLSEITIIVSVLIMHRIILSYSEIEYWIQYSHNSVCASLCLFFGLLILGFVCKICFEPFSNNWEKAAILIYIIFTICVIYALKVAEGKATFYFFSFSSTGAIETILFWSGCYFGFLYGLLISLFKTCVERKSSANKLIASAIVCCTFLMASQSSTSNVILISIQILYSLTFTDVLKNHKKSLILLHVWLGHLFFHYQQNHILNLDKIQEVIYLLFSLDFNLIINGLIAIVNQFSAPILAYFLCIQGQLNNNFKKSPSENVLKINRIFMICQLMMIIVYALGIMLRSPTEWSWTFLYMKLIYEIIYMILLILITFGVQTVVTLHDIILTPSVTSDIV